MAPTAFSSSKVTPAVSARVCASRAHGERQIAATTAGLAAAVLLTASPAFAGVSYVDKPKLKNYTTENIPNPIPPVGNPADRLKGALQQATSGSGEPKEEKKKAPPPPPGPQFEFNTQSLWPIGIVAVGGALFAAPKVDSGFDKIFQTGWVKDSSANAFGIGTEDVLKEKGGYMAAYYPEENKSGGTKAIKKERDPKKVPGKRKKVGLF